MDFGAITDILLMAAIVLGVGFSFHMMREWSHQFEMNVYRQMSYLMKTERESIESRVERLYVPKDEVEEICARCRRKLREAEGRDVS